MIQMEKIMSSPAWFEIKSQSLALTWLIETTKLARNLGLSQTNFFAHIWNSTPLHHFMHVKQEIRHQIGKSDWRFVSMERFGHSCVKKKSQCSWLKWPRSCKAPRCKTHKWQMSRNRYFQVSAQGSNLEIPGSLRPAKLRFVWSFCWF